MTKNEALMEKAIKEAMGKEVIIREIRGKIVVTDKPEFKERILSQKQDLVTVCMMEANEYAKGIIKDENLKNAAQIRLNVTRERLYTALVSEFWKTNWEKEKRKHEAAVAKEKEQLINQKKADLNTSTTVDATKPEETSGNKASNPDAG